MGGRSLGWCLRVPSGPRIADVLVQGAAAPERAGLRAAVGIYEDEPAELAVDIFDRPLDAVERDPPARRDLQEPPCRHHTPQIGELSLKGLPRSTPTSRRQSSRTMFARPTEGTLDASANSENVITRPSRPPIAVSNWSRMPSGSLAGRRREDK
nr:hypothetical protein OG781_11410 [Streptomyces sp. NBC_00830]